MKIKTPPSKTQLRLLQILGVTETPSNYVMAGEWLETKGYSKDAYVGAFGWRQIAKWTDEEFLQKIEEYRKKQGEKYDQEKPDFY